MDKVRNPFNPGAGTKPPLLVGRDGQLEAVELPSATWIVGAQWHPEDTASRQPQQQALYDELIRRAAARASRS